MKKKIRNIIITWKEEFKSLHIMSSIYRTKIRRKTSEIQTLISLSSFLSTLIRHYLFKHDYDIFTIWSKVFKHYKRRGLDVTFCIKQKQCSSVKMARKGFLLFLFFALFTTFPPISFAQEEQKSSVIEVHSLNRSSFPTGFVFGTASAAYQVNVFLILIAKPFTFHPNLTSCSYLSSSHLPIVRRCCKRRWKKTKYMGCIHPQISRFYLLCFTRS